MDNHYIDNEYNINEVRKHLNLIARFSEFYYFVFLCGKELDKSGEGSGITNREIVEKYFKEKTDNVKVVLSEKLYDRIKHNDIDLLTYEELLLDLSDKLILFVESFGTFAELGAFSMSDLQDIKKLTVINDIRHIDDESFINDGPIKKIREKGAKVIYSDIENGGLLRNVDVMNELNGIVTESKGIHFKRINKEPYVRVNSFIFEILDLLKIYGPISNDHLLKIYKKVKGFDSFTFIKSDGNTFFDREKITPYVIFDIMEGIGFVDIVDSKLRLSKEIQDDSLLFNFSNYGKNRFRSKMIRRKFKKGENPCMPV